MAIEMMPQYQDETDAYLAEHTLYDCEICGGLYPWQWDGDCRDNANRYGSVEQYASKQGISAEHVTVRSMDERVNADME